MKKTICLLILSLFILAYPGVAQVKHHTGKTSKRKKSARIQYGTASFYNSKFNGRRTANGEIFSQKKLTAAHNSVPLGTWIG